MKDYYLYLDPDDGILYVQKEGEIIAPIRTSASFDPKTIRVDDGYLQVKDFVSDAWIYICDKDGNAVSLKGPSGETANLDLSRDVESVLIDSNNEVDGDHILSTTVRCFLGSKQIKITNENLKVTTPNGWECVYHNQLYYYDSGNPDYSVKYTFKVPAKTKFNISSEQIKIETVGLPFAFKTFTVHPNWLNDIWNIECTPSWFQVDVKGGITYPTHVSKIDIVPINKKHQAFPSDYSITATQNGNDLPVYKNQDSYYIDIPTDHCNDISVYLKNSDEEVLDKAVIEFMFDSKSAHVVNAEHIQSLSAAIAGQETVIQQLQIDLGKKQDSDVPSLPEGTVEDAILCLHEALNSKLDSESSELPEASVIDAILSIKDSISLLQQEVNDLKNRISNTETSLQAIDLDGVASAWPAQQTTEQ